MKGVGASGHVQHLLQLKELSIVSPLPTRCSSLSLSRLSLFIYTPTTQLNRALITEGDAKLNESPQAHADIKMRPEVEGGNNFCNATRIYWTVIE